MPRAFRSGAYSKTLKQVFKLLVEMAALSTPRGRLASVSALFLFLAALGPGRLERGPSLCLFSKIIGRPCPGCGMTRAASAFSRGHFLTAARYNPLIFPAMAALAFELYHDLNQLGLIRATKRGIDFI